MLVERPPEVRWSLESNTWARSARTTTFWFTSAASRRPGARGNQRLRGQICHGSCENAVFADAAQCTPPPQKLIRTGEPVSRIFLAEAPLQAKPMLAHADAQTEVRWCRPLNNVAALAGICPVLRVKCRSAQAARKPSLALGPALTKIRPPGFFGPRGITWMANHVSGKGRMQCRGLSESSASLLTAVAAE